MRPQQVQAEIDLVKANPLATPAEVHWLENFDPMDALLHPNCPEEPWWRLAFLHPLPALASPVGQLLLLEAPEKWMTLERRRATVWIGMHLERLKPRALRCFALDCAERVLPSFEQWFYLSLGGNSKEQARKTIHIARLFADSDGKRTKPKQLCAAYDAAVDARGSRSAGAPLSMLQTAALVAKVKFRVREADDAARYAAEVMYYTANPATPTDTAAFDDERVWQWRRLLQHLRGEV